MLETNSQRLLVQLAIPGHGARIITVLGDQLLQPLNLTSTLVSLLGQIRLLGLLEELLDNVCCLLVVGVVCDAAPLFSRLVLGVAALVKVVERIVERVGLGGADDADDLAVSVALDTRFGDDGVFNRGDGEGIVGVGAGCGCAELLLCSTSGSLETSYETETAVVLRECLLLVPIDFCVS
ncbi:hypothetical protein HG531_003532 [Fusarium graminearum]|nr:hypothetical protein HG531_003532 [Fusarium graminearum]